MQRVFRDPEMNRRFLRDGYVVFPLLNQSEIDQLRRAFDKFNLEEHGQFTINSMDTEYRRTLNQAIYAVMAPKVARVFDDFTFFASNFVIKPSGGQHLPLHQDNAIVDESKDMSVNTWCPLMDVDETNSCLTVVPQSHLWSDYRRAFGDKLENSPFKRVVPLLVEQYETPAPVKAGHALVYHSRTMHGSMPNDSSNLRVATLSASTPRGTQLVFHHRVSPDEIELFACEEDFYWKEMFVFTRPKFAPSLGVHRFDYGEPFSEEQFLAIVERTAASFR